MSPGRILFADNDQNFLRVRSEFLRQDYEVIEAYSLEEAKKQLQEQWIHLAILDIRILNDDDERDVSGLILAKNENLRTIPKIMLTGFPSYAYVREVMRFDQHGIPAAIDFLSKQEGPEAMLQTVKAAFTQHVRINWDLIIRWREPFSFFHLLNLIQPEPPSVFLLTRVNELEDLFRKLFYPFAQITLGRLLAQRKDKVLLEIYAYSSEGAEAQFVVACGQKQAISDENAHYAAFIAQWGGPMNAIQLETAVTLHFAASLYRLTGSTLEELTPFQQFYAQRRTDEVLAALDYLFTTLSPWYTMGRFYVEDKSLESLYADWLELPGKSMANRLGEQQIGALCKATLTAGPVWLDYELHKLTLHLLDGLAVFYPNPLAHLSAAPSSSGATLCGIAHGRLDASSILVAPDGQTWLVDFAKTGQGPLLRDFVTLEMAVRLDLLDTIDLQACYKFEKQLLIGEKLTDAVAFEQLPAEFDKPLRTVGYIRQRAAVVVGPELTPYLLGLFFCALARVMTFDPTIRYTKRELVPFAHSLLLAAMLSEKFTNRSQSTTQLSSAVLDDLWLNESNREVWVEGRQAELTPQDFDILAYLYRNRGQVCSRQAIVENALGEVYKDESTETSRLNSAMSRLRQKIESDPEHPKYLITIRGYGYKLM